MAIQKKTKKQDLNPENTQGPSRFYDDDVSMAFSRSQNDYGPSKSKVEDVSFQADETVVENLHTEEKEEAIPMSLVQKMLNELENKFTSQINKLKVKASRDEMDDDLQYVRDLEDDYMEIPSIFFSFSINYSLHGDNKRGMHTEPPQGPIKFKPLIRTKKRGQKGTQVVSVSSVKVHSKEVAEYLRNHSQFGIAFYENMDSAMNVDSTWAQKMIEAQQSINRLSDMQIIARAKQEGIAVSQSPEAMRKMLVERDAKRRIAQQESVLYGSLKIANLDHQNRAITEKTISSY